jgi:high-affinity Fe2+/Pb2+ permease
MRKLITGLSVAAIAAAAMATPAMARMESYQETPATAEVVTGAAVGTAAGVGLSEGWFGSGTAATALGATAGTAAVAGGVAGIGTVALLDAAVQPCRGFHALFGLNRDACVNGEYVGYAPERRGYRER